MDWNRRIQDDFDDCYFAAVGCFLEVANPIFAFSNSRVID